MVLSSRVRQETGYILLEYKMHLNRIELCFGGRLLLQTLINSEGYYGKEYYAAVLRIGREVLNEMIPFLFIFIFFANWAVYYCEIGCYHFGFNAPVSQIEEPKIKHGCIFIWE